MSTSTMLVDGVSTPESSVVSLHSQHSSADFQSNARSCLERRAMRQKDGGEETDRRGDMTPLALDTSLMGQNKFKWHW